MTLLELLQSKTDDELRELLDHALPMVAQLAQEVLDSRPSAQDAATRHGTGCRPGCCGAGVRQWR